MYIQEQKLWDLYSSKLATAHRQLRFGGLLDLDNARESSPDYQARRARARMTELGRKLPERGAFDISDTTPPVPDEQLRVIAKILNREFPNGGRARGSILRMVQSYSAQEPPRLNPTAVMARLDALANSPPDQSDVRAAYVAQPDAYPRPAPPPEPDAPRADAPGGGALTPEQLAETEQFLEIIQRIQRIEQGGTIIMLSGERLTRRQFSDLARGIRPVPVPAMREPVHDEAIFTEEQQRNIRGIATRQAETRTGELPTEPQIVEIDMAQVHAARAPRVPPPDPEPGFLTPEDPIF